MTHYLKRAFQAVLVVAGVVLFLEMYDRTGQDEMRSEDYIPFEDL